MSELSPEELLEVVRDVLIASGPMDVQGLTRALRVRGVAVDDDHEWFDWLLWETDPLIMPVGEDDYAWLPAVLEGRVFTHRLTHAEAAHDYVTTSEDLLALEMLFGEPPYDRLTDGGEATMLYPTDAEFLEERGIPAELVAGGALLLVPGTLAGLGVGAGSMVGMRAQADGLAIVAVPEDEAVGNSVGKVMAGLVAESADRPPSLEPILWRVLADDGSLLRTAEAPLDEQLRHARLERRGALVAAEGFDFEAMDIGGRLREIKDVYDLYDDEALAVVTLLTVTAHEDLAAIMDISVPAERATVPNGRRRFQCPQAQSREQRVYLSLDG